MSLIKISSKTKRLIGIALMLFGDRLNADEQAILEVILEGGPSKEQLRAALAALTATPPTATP